MGIISAWWLMYDWGVIAHQSQIFLSSNLQGIKNTSILVCESGHVSGSYLSLPSANPSERLITGMSKLLFCCYFRRRQATAGNTCMSAYTGYGYPEVKSILKARFQAISFFPYVQQNTKCIAKGRMIKQRISERKPTAHSLFKCMIYMCIYVCICETEDITCPSVDRNFIFKCSTWYLMCEHSERLRYQVEHEKVKFVSTSGHVLFCFLYKHANDNFFTIFWRFPNTFQRFPKILQKLSEGQTNVSEHFPKISKDYQRFPKITEDIWGRSDYVLITQQHI